MFSIVGSHLWIRLIFTSSSRGAGAHFRRYNYRTHSITKKTTKLKVGTYNHKHIKNYLHLGMYLGNVL